MSLAFRSSAPGIKARALVRLFRIPRSVVEAAGRSVELRRSGADTPHSAAPNSVALGSAQAVKGVREAFAAADFSPLSRL